MTAGGGREAGGRVAFNASARLSARGQSACPSATPLPLTALPAGLPKPLPRHRLRAATPPCLPARRRLPLPAGLGTGDLQIMMVDEAVPAAWENSVAAQEELGAATAPIVRRAVGLGRQLLDPLALLASLCGSGREVLALPLHPLQAQVGGCGRTAAGCCTYACASPSPPAACTP